MIEAISISKKAWRYLSERAIKAMLKDCYGIVAENNSVVQADAWVCLDDGEIAFTRREDEVNALDTTNRNWVWICGVEGEVHG